MKKLSDKQIAILAVVIVVLTNGISPVFSKISLREFSPEVFNFFRFVTASLCLLPFFLKNKIKLDKSLVGVILVSLILTANVLFFAHGLRLTTATISQILYVLGPIAIVPLSYFLLKEKITLRKIIGVTLGVLGAGLIILLPVIEKGNPFAGDMRGNIILLGGVLATALFTVLSKKMHAKFSPIQITMIFALTTCFVTFVLSLPEIINNSHEIISASSQAWFGVLYLGSVGTALFYLLYQYAIKHGTPLIASTVLFLTPFATIIWAGIILGERLTWLLAVGAVFVLFGTYFIVKSGKKSEIDL